MASLPLRRSALFASKTKTNPIPPPCLSEEGERARRGGERRTAFRRGLDGLGGGQNATGSCSQAQTL